MITYPCCWHCVTFGREDGWRGEAEIDHENHSLSCYSPGCLGSVPNKC